MMTTIRSIFIAAAAAAAGFAVGAVSYRSSRSAEPESAGRDGPGQSALILPAVAVVEDRQSSDSQVLGLLFQGNQFRHLAELGTILGRLDSTQIGALLDRLDRPGVENRGPAMQRLMAYWARRDPQSA